MDAIKLASLFKALSEPVRVRIMALLIDRGELCVCDLVEGLGLSQGVVSRHLAYLRNNELVTARREGVWMYYQINKPIKVSIKPLLTMIKQSTKDSEEHKSDLARLSGQRPCG